MKKKKIVVIGAGASGMMAAITASRAGCAVTLLEKQDRVGKKILSTGNGRCNISNDLCSVKNYHGKKPQFVNGIFKQFSQAVTRDFFESIGLCLHTEDNGKIFPRSGQASAVLDVLRYELEYASVEVVVNIPIEEIIKKGDDFVLKGAGKTVCGNRVIVTTGNRAMPQLGGTRSGIDLLKNIGHREIKQFPVLVPLKAKHELSKQMKGVKIHALVKLFVNHTCVEEHYGEILFTEYGLSGPPIIQLSIKAQYALQNNFLTYIIIDIFPDMSTEHLLEYINQRVKNKPHAFVEFFLVGLIHKKLISAVLHDAHLTKGQMCASQMSEEQRKQLVRILKGWKFPVNGSLSWIDAHVSAGGICTDEFCETTLQSRIIQGVFAAGEILDITGDCGGYNLQWAWSSGYVAGLHAVKD